MEKNNDHNLKNPDEAFEFLIDRLYDEKRKLEWTKSLGSTSEFESENESKRKDSSRKRFFFKLSAIAASLLILITASVWFFDANQNSISSYAANHIQNSNLNIEYNSNTRGADATLDNTDKDQLRKEIGKMIYEKDFNQAIGIFREYEKNNRLDDIDKIFFATALLKVENEDNFKAVSLLSDIIKHKSNYYEEALWYRALAYGAVENKVKMKMDLETLLKESEYQKTQAEILLNKLKN